MLLKSSHAKAWRCQVLVVCLDQRPAASSRSLILSQVVAKSCLGLKELFGSR